MEKITVVRDRRSVSKIDTTVWLLNRTRQNVYLALLVIFALLAAVCLILLIKKGGGNNFAGLIMSIGAIVYAWKKRKDELAIHRRLSERRRKRGKPETLDVDIKETIEMPKTVKPKIKKEGEAKK